MKKEKKFNNSIKKSNENHTKDSSINTIKKPLSATRNNKSNINKNNPPNTILNYNYNYRKKKNRNIKNISLIPDYINKTTLSYFPDKFPKSCSNIKKNIDPSINKKKNKNKSSSSRTQRAKEYSIKVQQFNLGNSLINNRCYNYKNYHNKKKIINRANSGIINGINKNVLNDVTSWKKISKQKKLNENNNQILINGGYQNEQNFNKNIEKSRNKKNNSEVYYKSNSNENKKINELTSKTTLTINMKAIIKNVENKKLKYNKPNYLNNSIVMKKIKSFNNNNASKIYIPSNYVQIYLRNQLKSPIENKASKNQLIVYNMLNGVKKIQK